MRKDINDSIPEVLHNSCNTGNCALPDMSALLPRALHALRHRAYISGNALLPVLQLLILHMCHV